MRIKVMKERTRHVLLGCASRWLASVLAVVAVLAGCTVGPDYKRPEIVVPENWRNGSVGKSIANLGWWQLSEDSTLQELIGATMVANRDLQLAAARVLDARAQLGIARASQFPQLSAGSSYANERPYSANSFFLRGLPGHIAPPTGWCRNLDNCRTPVEGSTASPTGHSKPA